MYSTCRFAAFLLSALSLSSPSFAAAASTTQRIRGSVSQNAVAAASSGEMYIFPSRFTSAEQLARAKMQLLAQQHLQLQQQYEREQQARRNLDSDSDAGEAESAQTQAQTRVKSDMELMLTAQYAVFDGLEFYDEGSYWMKALRFVEDTSVGMSNARIAQRYALMCMFHATNAVATPYTDEMLDGSGSMAYTWLKKWGYDTSGDVNDECTWYGITCNGSKQVTGIALKKNILTGTAPIELILLQNTLTVLDLEENYLHNYGWTHVWWLGDLTNLQVLSIGSNGFGYENLGLPTEFKKLTKLKELSLHDTYFDGPILDGSILSPMTNLQYLDLGGVSFGGSSFPTTLKDLSNLEFLYLEHCDFAGGLSNLIGDGTGFASLQEMWLDGNDRVSGSIPSAIGGMTTLTSIGLSNCGLSGAIPTEMSSGLVNLKKVWLYDNALSGDIPAEFASDNLEILLIHDNDFSGNMPSELCAVREPLSRLATLTADCDSAVTCDCCTCCGSNCDPE
ncbi:hypothetical protein ACA910_013830 [Epithemia clementina (nom. ined.)]